MAKSTAWIVIVIGLLLVLAELGWLTAITAYNGWIIAIAVLLIGIGKLRRSYGKKRR